MRAGALGEIILPVSAAQAKTQAQGTHVYVPTRLSGCPTIDCVMIPAALRQRLPSGSGLTRHRRTKGPELLPTVQTGMLACMFVP